MPQLQMDAIKRLQPNRLLLVGNALSRDGEFYDSHHAKRNLYHRIAISAFDTPNFTGEDGGRRGMITLEDVEEFAARLRRGAPALRRVGARGVPGLAGGLAHRAGGGRVRDGEVGG